VELHNLYASVTIIRVTRWARHVARIREINAYNILVGKSEGKRPRGRPRRRWVDNNRMDVREIGWKDMDWMHHDDDRDGHRNVGILRTPNAADSPRRLYQVHSPRKHQDLYGLMVD
jgi:hypothetical protein